MDDEAPSIYARWSFLAVGLMIFIGGAILLRTLRPGGVRRIQTILRRNLHRKLNPQGLSGDPVVSPPFLLSGAGGSPRLHGVTERSLCG